MKKAYVIKNTENNKYFTNDYNGWWSLDIKDADTFATENEVARALTDFMSPENELGAFDDVKSVIIETVWFK